MEIILTHEQADFDAIASLLGAHILNENAIPVLPRRMNRNVQAFLTLYGVELPFVDPRDLPGHPIESLILVDTQSYVSLKGIDEATKVNIIDHHPLRPNLNPDWSIHHAELGATTTLLVEAIQQRDILISTVHATLLLLGIYEDTGSLTYTRTTERDLMAAAFLVAQGADLRIANNYLNHPLSHNQQALYDKLRKDAQYLHVHGYTIIITCGEALEMYEELSTIAHKLRDLLDPDAIFMLIETRGGIQMIARSTNDNIDVAEILSSFGGGGHERAAAGLVRNRTVEDLCHSLAELLPDYVIPSITVAQIMSQNPQLLAPETPVNEALVRMQRYGYEGYPVIKDGRIIGLLTRRAVDRAIAHNLNLTAASLMEAGNFSVHPAHSIEDLKRVVTDSGWGQIPVTDPKTGDVIGIVTRTDLLKALTPKPKIPSRHNLAPLLEAALPEDVIRILITIANVSHENQMAVYIVGGFVRDLILKEPSIDFDLVVEGDAIALTKALVSRFGGRVTSHARFGTAKWILPETFGVSGEESEAEKIQSIDLVSARTEFYPHPTALPKVEKGSIKLDLHRRDFTINTLALRLNGHHYGELHDYWGGYQDIRSGFVRVLHSLSFVDDPTRIIRAVRFEQRFNFQIEQRTLELLREALPLINRVSGDRIRHEFNRIVDQNCAPAIFSRLKDLGLLGAIHPQLTWDDWLDNCFESLPTELPDPDWELTRYASIKDLRHEILYVILLLRHPGEIINEICDRLKLPYNLREKSQGANRLFYNQPNLHKMPTSGIVDFLDDLDPLSIYAVYLTTPDPKFQRTLHEYSYQWRKITPNITGDDLRGYGLPPGPQYRSILQSLRDAWLDGVISDEAQEKELLIELLNEANNDVNNA